MSDEQYARAYKQAQTTAMMEDAIGRWRQPMQAPPDSYYSDMETPIHALELALELIDSYAMDIRYGEDRVGVDLVAKGFCQGSLYLRLTERLRARLKQFQSEEGY